MRRVQLLMAVLVVLFLGITGSLIAQSAETQRAADIPAILEHAKQVHTWLKNNRIAFPDQEKHVRARSFAVNAPAAAPQACCSTWQGFDFTGILSVAPTDPTATSCVNCAPGFSSLNLGMAFPQGVAFRGNPWSTIMSFHSQVPGACTITFLWYRPPTTQPIMGFQSQNPDCGANNVWIWEFFNFTVPNVTGNAIAVGVIQASNGKVDVDYEQFLIQ